MSTGSGDEASKDLEETQSEEGLLDFLNSLSGVPKEVALKIFPDLAKLLGRGTKAFERMQRTATEANTKSHESALEHEKFVASVYAEQLRLESLTPEERASLNERLEAGAKRVFEKDTENKALIQNVLKLAGAGVLGALALAVVLVGGNSAIKNAKV